MHVQRFKYTQHVKQKIKHQFNVLEKVVHKESDISIARNALDCFEVLYNILKNKLGYYQLDKRK